MKSSAPSGLSRFGRIPAIRALSHRDFRVLWLGAFVSFTGGQAQGVAQGYLVFEMTGSEAKLALVMFAAMVPVSIFGPLMGVVADVVDRRKVLVVTMLVSSAGALFLGYAALTGFIRFEHILAVALLSGFVQTIEMPARQSIVREVVPAHDLAAAVPTMAMTFNLARIVGPAVGGLMAYAFGVASCFLINAASFFGLVFAALAIRADLRPTKRDGVEPVRDLIAEGMLYTMREKPLRTLFLMECATSLLSIFYLSMMPALAKDVLGLDKRGLGFAMSCIGVGAFSGLILLSTISDKPLKALLVRVAMITMAAAIFCLGFAPSPWIAFPLLALMGMSAIVQFNTTNTLFQLMAPARLRGRVLAMHMWAISGVAPIGILVFGGLASVTGVPWALKVGGALLLMAGLAAWRPASKIPEPDRIVRPDESGLAESTRL